MRPDENKVPLADTYYHLNLVPRHFSCEYPINVYIKGENLALFLSDVAGAYKVKVFRVNFDGFEVRKE
ncbi:hypothetical protein [Paenibacillus larvae]|uniref:hypothetical protein n=1 Tax=Paenibacillus larvae TaxID=1464 RepID=UPI0005A62369|nr:hypothetical protein [Paenibacillus larvae]AVG13019.1 hypothetical protein ERICII_02665 [Paenibacillus larvae subsp. larvae DSM 25430]MDR5568986.1 hypothetical protein [Paenibacillus larvae]MDR5596737.1 hypothetical protein [Paenibacillus larvae]